MKNTSDALRVTFDASHTDESVIYVARAVNGKIDVLKMELGEQAELLYHLLTEKTAKVEIAESKEQDVVSRQEVLKYFEGWKNQIKYYHPYAKNFDIPYEEAIQRIKDVPPVKCVSSENPNKCEDVISRQAVLDATVNKNSIWNNITNSEGDNLETIVSNLPPVNSQKTDEQILTEIFVIYQRRIPAIAYKSNYIPRMGDIIHFPHFGGFRVKSVAYRIADDAGIDGNRLMWVELFVEKYKEINCKTTKCENAGEMNV